MEESVEQHTVVFASIVTDHLVCVCGGGGGLHTHTSRFRKKDDSALFSRYLHMF
jgi:hypothetical protein